MTAREMKDSGVDWLGEIPLTWSLQKISTFYSLRNQKVSDKDYLPLSVTKKGVLPQLENVAKSDDGDNRKLVKKGDFVINSRSDRRGSCGISPLDGSVSLINTVLIPRGQANPQYLDWLFHTKNFADEFYKWGRGIVDDLWSTRWQDMKRITIPVPALEEQYLIAEFLNEKCSEINSLTDDIEKQIETLQEYKKSVITEAVTKGLDPNVEMKDSGVEWIGTIPACWEVHRIKTNFDIIGGNGFSPSLQGQETGDLPVCKASDISNAGAKLSKAENFITFSEAKLYSFNLIPKGSVLFAKIGEAMKKNNRTLTLVECCADNNCQAMVPKEIDSQFGYYLFNCIDMTWFDNAGTVPCISNQKLKNSKIPYPSIFEQKRIAKYLNNKCAEIDSLTADLEKQLETLAQYKQSIIYEYVTGKKTVSM